MHQKAKLFQNGGSQAVRLPKDCRFEGAEVLIHREGTRIILEPIEPGWSPEFLREFSGPQDDSFPERQQPLESRPREGLD